MKKWFAWIGVLFLFLGVSPLLHSEEQTTAELPRITTAQYDKLEKENQVFVLVFTADYCPPCQRAKRALKPWWSPTFDNMKNVHIYEINTLRDNAEQGEKLNQRLQVTATPTFIVLFNGSVQYRHEGFSEKDAKQLQSELLAAVNSFKESAK